MKEISVQARCEELDTVADFVSGELDLCGCDEGAKFQVLLAIEEIFINIANYAYNPKIGTASVRCCVQDKPLQVTIQFLDNGKPFNPLESENPDTTLSAEEREIGGVGIYLVKKYMEFVEYEYKDGSNVLTIKKLL